MFRWTNRAQWTIYPPPHNSYNGYKIRREMRDLSWDYVHTKLHEKPTIVLKIIRGGRHTGMMVPQAHKNANENIWTQEGCRK
jgi:hypothetical protein